MRNLILMAVVATFLVACGGEKVLSVEHYKEHEEDRTQRLQDCQRLTEAEFATDKNCAHALAAAKELEAENNDWIDW